MHLSSWFGCQFSSLAEIVGAETSLAAPVRNEPLSEAGRLGVRVFEDLTSLAGGGWANWLQVFSLQRTLALDILE
jgi:predicted ThiF/HesA family dinucleotide-utilizing enzyme